MANEVAPLVIAVDSSSVPRAVKDLKDLEGVSKSVQSAVSSLADSFMRISSFGTIRSLMEFGEAIKDSALLAARYETLGVAMNQIGATAGYTSIDLAKYESALEKTGISALQSRGNIVKLIAANVDLEKSARLARVAQDLAVVGNMNSSESFAKLVQGIQTGQVRLLHNIGIMVTFEDAYRKMAKELGKNTKELTDFEKVQARTNAAIEYGERLAGTYEAAMGTAGKQLRTMERYTENLRVSMGGLFGPALVSLVESLNSGFEKMSDSILKAKASGEWENWQGKIAAFSGAVVTAVTAVINFRSAIAGLVAGWLVLRSSMLVVGIWSSLKEAIEVANVALRATAIANMQVFQSATVATVAMEKLRMAVAAVGGPYVVLAAILTALAVAWYASSDSLKESNEKLMENTKKEADATQSKLDYIDVVNKQAAAERSLSEDYKKDKANQNDLAIAKQKLLGMGSEYNVALIREAKSFEQLAAAQKLVTYNNNEQNIKKAEAAIRGLNQELKEGPGFWAQFWDFHTNDSVIKFIKDVNDKLTESNKQLGLFMETKKKLEQDNKGKVKTPEEEAESKKKLDQQRALEDAWNSINRSRLSGDKAITDEEKLHRDIALSELDTAKAIVDIRRKFADQKIAGGPAEMNKLIAALKEAGLTAQAGYIKAFDAKRYRDEAKEARDLANDLNKLNEIKSEVSIIDDNGLQRSLLAVESRFNSMKDNVKKIYDNLIDNIIKKNGTIDEEGAMSPEFITLMKEYSELLAKIEKGRAAGTIKATNEKIETDVNRLTEDLRKAQSKAGYTYTWDEQQKAIVGINTQLGLMPGALEKVQKQLKDQEDRSKDYFGGMKAGFRDFASTSSNVYDQMRKASERWLDGFGDKLAEIVVTGKGSFKDLAQSIILDITKIMIKSLMVQAIWKMMGWISGSWDGTGNGSQEGYDSMFEGARAGGGSVNGGSAYLVGEVGPELFIPSQSGTIVPNNSLSSVGNSTTNIVINIDANGNTEVNSPSISPNNARALAEKMADVARQVIIEERRPKGLLAS